MVNEDGKANGLYRLTDTNGDDQFDKTEKLVTMAGGGEHGLHSMTVSPDGKRIYFNCGNHTKLPEGLSESAVPQKFGRKTTSSRASGTPTATHAASLAPGGFICSMNPDGSNVELFCSGFRNEFDITFDDGGELFTYDADMEWDIGSPWYRPTRINHCVSGGDFGWRSGAANGQTTTTTASPPSSTSAPAAPPASPPAKAPSSPPKIPARLFVNDWTYGTMWAIHLDPARRQLQGHQEEFVFGKPLPLTDVVIHPRTAQCTLPSAVANPSPASIASPTSAPNPPPPPRPHSRRKKRKCATCWRHCTQTAMALRPSTWLGPTSPTVTAICALPPASRLKSNR
jgi:hypothetical protein